MHCVRLITWPQLGLGLLFAAYLALRHGAMDGWNLERDGLWLVMAAIVAVVILVQAFRKWRIEQADRKLQ